mgnify:CR=1 FL=1
MPNFIKPITKLSESQWRAILERTIMREGKSVGVPSSLKPSLTQAMEGTAPPAERVMGRLYKPDLRPGFEGAAVPEDLPWEAAKAKYLADPSAYLNKRASIPPAKHLGFGMEPGSPQDVSQALVPGLEPKGVVYESLKYKPVVGAGEAKAQKAIESIFKEEGGPPPKVEQLVQDAAVFDIMWKQIGGMRSAGGKLWEMYWKGSNKAKSETINTARDYFLWCATQWKKNPTWFKSKYPREVKMLERYWGEAVGSEGVQ